MPFVAKQFTSAFALHQHAVHFQHLVCLLLLSVFCCLCFLSLMCSVLHCSSILICAKPRADGDEADFMDADLIAGILHVEKSAG